MHTKEADDDPANGHDSRTACVDTIAEEPAHSQYLFESVVLAQIPYVACPVMVL